MLLHRIPAHGTSTETQSDVSDHHGDDVELCCAVNRRGEKPRLAINWDRNLRSVTLRNDPALRGAPQEAYRLNAEGRWSRREGTVRPDLQLQPGEVLVARFPARP